MLTILTLTFEKRKNDILITRWFELPPTESPTRIRPPHFLFTLPFVPKQDNNKPPQTFFGTF